MTPKSDDLIASRIEREQRWAYNLWLGRLSFSAIRRLANEPVSEGGLGYDLSEQAIKGLVKGAREALGDLTTTKADRVERQGAEVDERARAARHDFASAYAKANAIDEAIAALRADEHAKHDDPLAYANAMSRLISKRDQVAADLERADKRLDAVQAREARLFGLDAPSEAKLEVTSRDGVLDDLNDALARLGEKPITTPTPER